MIWVDREAKKMKDRGLPLEWVDDMKTPSGRVHVGALRGVVIHDLMYKALAAQDVPATFSYVFNDLDPMDAIPSYLEFSKWEQYSGVPLCNIPSPEPGAENFAEFYAKEFTHVFESINCHPQIIWGSKLYREGKMNSAIVEILNHAEEVRKIYEEVAHAHRADNWFPFQPICEKCGKLGTTVVDSWDGKHVTYRCHPHLVTWAKGCGHEGKISPLNGNGKLLWKLDWPATWKVVGVTIEGSGKDHMSSGGSYDMAKEFCKRVINYPAPYALPYEWFIIGGKKMSSSKGVGTSAKEMVGILPPEVFRFLIVRTPIGTALDFNPNGDTIPNLFDDYDRCLNAYFDKLENKLGEGKQAEVKADFARIAELSEVRPLPEKRLFLCRFRKVADMVRAKQDVFAHFTSQKGSDLTSEEKEMLQERVEFAEIYLQKYAVASQALYHFISQIPATIKPTEEQKKFLSLFKEALTEILEFQKESVTTAISVAMGKSGIKPRDAFRIFYQITIGQDAGPRAADMIIEYGKDVIIRRLSEAVSE